MKMSEKPRTIGIVGAGLLGSAIGEFHIVRMGGLSGLTPSLFKKLLGSFFAVGTILALTAQLISGELPGSLLGGIGLLILLAIAGVFVAVAGTAISLGLIAAVMPPMRLVMIDRGESSLNRARSNLIKGLTKVAGKDPVSRFWVSLVVRFRVTFSTDYAALKRCDVVVEAVFEDLDIKLETIRRIESVVRANCVIASNTSHIQRSTLCEQLSKQSASRFVILHHFYPANKNLGLEVVVEDSEFGEQLAAELINWQHSLGRVCVPVKDRWGFIFNTYLEAFCLHVIEMLEQKIGSVKEIDHIAENVFGSKMGPFKLINQIRGAGIIRIGLEGLSKEFPWISVPETITHLAESQGSFETAQLDAFGNTVEIVHVSPETEAKIRDSLLGAYCALYAWAADLEACDRDDLAMGIEAFFDQMFPRDLLHELGAEEIIRLAKGFAVQHDDFTLSPCFNSVAATTEYFKAARVKRQDVTYFDGTVAILELREPNKGNLLSPDALDDLEVLLTTIETDKSIGFVITGAGSVFTAGAHLGKWMPNWDNIEKDATRAVTRGKTVLALLERVSVRKPSVAAINGFYCLGGGVELSLRTSRRLATTNPNLKIGLVEATLGLLPGWDGTVYAPRLVRPECLGEMLEFIRNGKKFSPFKARELGLVEALHEPADLIRCAVSDVRWMANCELHMRTATKGPVANAPSNLPKISLRRLSKSTDAILVNLLERTLHLDATEASELEGEAFVEVLQTRDAKTGVTCMLSPTRGPDGKVERAVFLHR